MAQEKASRVIYTPGCAAAKLCAMAEFDERKSGFGLQVLFGSLSKCLSLMSAATIGCTWDCASHPTPTLAMFLAHVPPGSVVTRPDPPVDPTNYKLTPMPILVNALGYVPVLVQPKTYPIKMKDSLMYFSPRGPSSWTSRAVLMIGTGELRDTIPHADYRDLQIEGANDHETVLSLLNSIDPDEKIVYVVSRSVARALDLPVLYIGDLSKITVSDFQALHARRGDAPNFHFSHSSFGVACVRSKFTSSYVELPPQVEVRTIPCDWYVIFNKPTRNWVAYYYAMSRIILFLGTDFIVPAFFNPYLLMKYDGSHDAYLIATAQYTRLHTKEFVDWVLVLRNAGCSILDSAVKEQQIFTAGISLDF